MRPPVDEKRLRTLTRRLGELAPVPDVRNMIASQLVEPGKLRELYEAIEPQLYRYPALDSDAFHRKLNDALA